MATAMLLVATKAEAIPAFARKYQLQCNHCHTIYPQLNRAGRDFRDNGFRMPDEVKTLLKKTSPAPVPSHPPAESPEENFWAFVPEQIPLSIQGKLHDVINPKGDIKTDFQLEELQLQAGGTFTPRVSYYLHHHLVEDGSPGTLYVAWLRFNDLFGSDWLNVTVGQTELPLSFSPEIERLSSFGYLAFDRQLGANPYNLSTPQLGAQLFGQSERGTKIWAGVVNGSGLAMNDATQAFDSNNFKDVYVRVAQEYGEHVVGGFAYYGQASSPADSGQGFDDRFLRVGGDAFLNFDKVIVSGTVLYARDDNPLGTGEQRMFYGGFAQGELFFNDRTVLTGRIDVVHQTLPTVFDQAAAATGGMSIDTSAFRVNTVAVTPGVQFLVRPNVKIGFEYQVRQTREEDRAIAQLHFSF
jgi:hypothetical protein